VSALRGEPRDERGVTLRLRGFAWEALNLEAARRGMTIEELVEFSVLYYLHDEDSDRLAHQASRSPFP
jgi:hypothetical protein